MLDWGGSMWQYCGNLPALLILSSEYTCTYDYISLIHIFEASFFFFFGRTNQQKHQHTDNSEKKIGSTPDFI